MKLSAWKNLPWNKPGTVRLTPEDRDDIYALYTLLSPSDTVECTTVRKVQINESSTSTADTAKMRMTLAVKVEKVDVDLEACAMRVNGRNVLENEWVRMGAYHTLDIEIGKPIKVTKEDGWDAMHRHILWQAGDPANKTEVGVVLMDAREGVGLVGSVDREAASMKVERRVEVKQPKKRMAGSSQAEKAEERFYVELEAAVRELLDFARLRAVIVAGDGRDVLLKRMHDADARSESRQFIEHKGKFIRFDAPSTDPKHVAALLDDPRVKSILEHTKTAQEQRSIGQLQARLHDSSGLAIYGLRHVLKANEYGAIRELLLSSSLFRSTVIEERKRYGRLVQDVQANGGKVLVFTPGSETERALDLLTGVAAILHFAVVEDE